MSEMKNIPEGWSIDVFSNVIDQIIDHRGKTPSKLGGDWSNEGFRAVSAKSIKNGTLVNEDQMNILPKNLYKKWMKVEIEFGDILLTSEAPLGEHLIWQSHEKIVLSQRVYGIRTNKNKLDSFYFNYFIDSNFYQHELKSRESGSTVTGIKQSELIKTKIIIPPLIEQKSIASILIAFDDKIDLLKTQNKILEETARTIFAEWFGKYQIEDELPDGYKFGELGDIALNHSKTFKFTHKNVVFINTGDVSEGHFLHSNEISPIGLPGQAKKSIELYDILYSEIRPKNKRFAFVDFDTSNYVVSTKFMIIRPKNDFSPFILYLILKNQETIDEFNIVAESRSGTFPQITFDAVKSFPILIPNKEKQNDFDNILLPIMEKKKLNYQQIQTLTKTRDELLPRLMSGEVRVQL